MTALTFTSPLLALSSLKNTSQRSLDASQNSSNTMKKDEMDDLANEAMRFAEKLCAIIQMEEMLMDIGADASAYTRMKRDLLDT